METVDLSESMWAFVIFDRWKCHYVPKQLLTGLLEDAQKRGTSLIKIEPASQLFIDLPGMIMVDRGVQKIRIDTADFCTPTSDFGVFYEKLRKSELRKFSDGAGYHKLHGWMHCVVFTPEQRELLLGEMNRMLSDVEKLAKVENDEFVRRIKQINSEGVKVVTPRDPESMKGILKQVVVSQKNEENN